MNVTAQKFSATAMDGTVLQKRTSLRTRSLTATQKHRAIEAGDGSIILHRVRPGNTFYLGLLDVDLIFQSSILLRKYSYPSDAGRFFKLTTFGRQGRPFARMPLKNIWKVIVNK